MKPSVFNIPSGAPFARMLAKGLLAEAGDDPLALTKMRILLPTRRACRTVREAFLQESGGKPLLLPRLQPLGDVEEDELLIGLAGTDLAAEMTALPPAMPPLRRRILLARAIGKMKDVAQNQELALVLAGDLAALLDQVHTEGLDFSALPTLVDERFARHWQLTTDFLKILSDVWPGILEAHGAIDVADRRNRLLRILAAHWQDAPPSGKVIAAGSTGSIPVVGDLLGVIARMEQGCLVLPGLDQAMDDESWAAVDDTHPQATLKYLLERIGCTRGDVKPWAGLDDADIQAPRRHLATEIMRPAATTDRWNGLAGEADTIQTAIVHLERLDCDTQEEEARAIALIFRHTLETDGKTAALVTSDRRLARRVVAACRRWGLTVDDSAGQRLHETGTGLYLRLVMQAANEGLSPGALLALLRHDLCSAGLSHRRLEMMAGAMEKALLRGPKPPPGFAGLRGRAAAPHRLPADSPAITDSLALLDRLEPALSPLLALCDGAEHPVELWIRHHLQAAEALAASDDRSGPERLWQGEAGEEAARFFASLLEESGSFPPLDGIGYLSALTVLMSNCPVRPRYGAHPRLAILGQLEARLLQADTVILGGLNEASWPQDAGHDPWMSRPMRQQFGLPLPERSIGLAAHDFVQGFCAPHVVLTRPIRLNNAPTIPARWLQRLDTVLQAAGVEMVRPPTPWLALARAMDHSVETRPCPRPAPCPPLDRRPSELPVTQIEAWLQDPYSIYAKYVLRLRKLNDLEKIPDASSRGTFLHHVLNEFVQDHPDALPQHAEQILVDRGLQHFRTLMDDSGFWRYWLPRFARIAGWIVRHESEWRQGARNAATEIQGRSILDAPGGPFTLTARADRIDRLKAGGMAIIDYKTGGVNLNKSAMKDGRAPQLPLEGMILNEGGFGEAAQGETRYLGYWKLTGGLREGDEIAIADDDVSAAIQEAKDGLLALIGAFRDPSTPYLSLPDPERVPRFQDYAHLARVQEWSVADDAEGDGE